MSETGELEKDNTSSSSSWRGYPLNSLEALSESLLRLCLAGAGGAFVGLSFRHSRRRVYYPFSSSTLHANPSHSYYENAPYTFAIRFAAFVGILEFHRLYSPTQMILSWNFHPISYLYDVLTSINISIIDLESKLQQHRDEDSTNDDSSWIPSRTSIITIFDYAMGGFVAGGIFSRFPNVTTTESGSPPQSSIFPKKGTDNEASSTKQKKLIGKGRRLMLPYTKPTLAPISNAMSTPIVISTEGYPSPLNFKHSFHFRRAILRGALPGLFLGFLAGLLQFSLDQLLSSLQKMEQEHNTLPNPDDEEMEDYANDNNSDIKSMTLDELKREIEILKNRKS